jgi:hypothetical protein
VYQLRIAGLDRHREAQTLRFGDDGALAHPGDGTDDRDAVAAEDLGDARVGLPTGATASAERTIVRAPAESTSER